MILDGALDPEADPVAETIAQGAGFQQAFEDFAAWCAEQAKCALGDDPAKATAAYQSLVRPLLDAPLPLADGRVLSFADANTGTSQALYAESLGSRCPTALQDLSDGDGAALMALADNYDGRDADGHYCNSLDAFLAIGCIDGSAPSTRRRPTNSAPEVAAAVPFTDSGDPPRGRQGRLRVLAGAADARPRTPAGQGCRRSWSSPPPAIRPRPTRPG